MQRKHRIDTLGAGLLITFSAIMGLNTLLIKLVNQGIAPVFQSGLRSALALIPVLAFMLITRQRFSIRDGSLLPGLFAGLLFSTEFCLLFIALDYTTVSRASVFFYTMPLWVAVGAHFLIPEEPLTVRRSVGLGAAIAGVALAFSQTGTSATDDVLLGDAMCIVAAMFWAGILIVARTTRLASATPQMQLLYQLLVSALLLTALAPLFGDLMRDFTPAIGAIFVFQAIVLIGIGFSVWFWILSVYPASDMASFSFLTPVSGVLFGWLVFDDEISATFLAALALVGVGIVLVTRKARTGA